jgi:hypothetical protein
MGRVARAHDAEPIGEDRMLDDDECLWHGCDAIWGWHK